MSCECLVQVAQHFPQHPWLTQGIVSWNSAGTSPDSAEGEWSSSAEVFERLILHFLVVFCFSLVLSREWMRMGVAGILIKNYGSFPHSLLSSSFLLLLFWFELILARNGRMTALNLVDCCCEALTAPAISKWVDLSWWLKSTHRFPCPVPGVSTHRIFGWNGRALPSHRHSCRQMLGSREFVSKMWNSGIMWNLSLQLALPNRIGKVSLAASVQWFCVKQAFWGLFFFIYGDGCGAKLGYHCIHN